MSMETVLVFASMTGRTLVLPPEQKLYLLSADEKAKTSGIDDFYAMEQLVASGRLNVITTEEFFEREAVTGGLGIKPVKPVNKMTVREITGYLTDAASQYEGGLPQLKPGHTGLVFPSDTGAIIDMKDPK
jgi:hypothetical protein